MPTLIDRLRSGDTPELINTIAADERVGAGELISSILSGRIVIPQNINHTLKRPIAVGKGLRTKVNANIGTSADFCELGDELLKLETAVSAGADAIMDLSTAGDLDMIRRRILVSTPIPLGTVPLYQAMVESQSNGGSLVDMSADDIFSVIERQAKDGVDFMTVHCGINRLTLDSLAGRPRIADVVSRGGAFIIAWMLKHDLENPLFEDYGRLLEIASKYDVTLSLGDGMRPGCLADASDRAQFQELITLGKLVDEARSAGVQVLVEGPGHMPFDQIEANVKVEKEICAGAPFYVLGPLVTDVAPGYDHITAAIGGTMAAAAGADFLCYVTPREHLGLPTTADVHDGVIVCRIAAHAADIVKGVPGAAEWDLEMAKARKSLDWESQQRLAIDPAKAKRSFEERGGQPGGTCTMCSDFCAMKLVSEFLGIEEVPVC